ncbi:MAG: hypothetical protein AAF542_19310 [Pseudomonadota bacterium]
MDKLTHFLKDAYDGSDDESVKIELRVNLGTLRKDRELFESFMIEALERLDQRTSSVDRARSRRADKTGQNRAAGRGRTRIQKSDVLAALEHGYSTVKDIANHINCDSGQLRKTLSRYVKDGTINRTGHGQYELS